MRPKVPLPNDANLPADVREVLTTLLPVNVFRMMAHVPASFRPLMDLAMSILFGSHFDTRKREIAVLRTPPVTRSVYEWTQHVAVGATTGLHHDYRRAA